MQIKSFLLFKLLLTFFLIVSMLGSAFACQPPIGATPASIAKKAQDSSYVFDGVVTEVADTFIRVRVEQYFKGEGVRDVRIAQHNEQQNSCSDHFVLDQRALFFANGDMEGLLDAVYDGAFGSIRELSANNFSEITTATECMATFEGGMLTVPCISLNGTKEVYQARLEAISAANGLKFLLSDAQQVADATSATDNPDKITAPKNCMATYKGGILAAPCIAHKETKKVYQAILDPTNSTGNLKFLVSYVQQETNTLIAMETENFDTGKSGSVPDNWMAGITGEGNFDWQLEEDGTAPSSPLVLKQSGEGEYPWCVKKEGSFSDGFVAVKFKAISGSIDQAAGLIWRWKDAHNYYVARANALENNVAIYYVKDGWRNAIRYVDLSGKLSVKQNVWQNLRVDFQGEHFIVSFEGETIIDIKDKHIRGEGVVGLWTKEDSVTSFDDFTYGVK